MQAMIFAAGLGTRLKPITDRIPKALLPIGGKTLLEWQLDKLRAAGIRDVVINIHHLADQIVAFCREHDNFGMQIRFSDEREQLLETGGGLRKAAQLLTGPVLVLNVDVLSNIDLSDLIRAHRPDDLATLVVSERQTQRYLCFAEDNTLAGWTNIATGEVKGSKTDRLLAFSGMHIVSADMLRMLQNWPERFPIMDFYLQACAEQSIHAYIPQDYRMMDIGKIDHLQEAERFAHSLI